jgi:hypothetical protein
MIFTIDILEVYLFCEAVGLIATIRFPLRLIQKLATDWLQIGYLGVWKVVAMDSLKFHMGAPCPTLLCTAGGPPKKRLYGQFWGGPPAKPEGNPTAFFYPFGHPTSYAYAFQTTVPLPLLPIQVPTRQNLLRRKEETLPESYSKICSTFCL